MRQRQLYPEAEKPMMDKVDDMRNTISLIEIALQNTDIYYQVASVIALLDPRSLHEDTPSDMEYIDELIRLAQENMDSGGEDPGATVWMNAASLKRDPKMAKLFTSLMKMYGVKPQKRKAGVVVIDAEAEVLGTDVLRRR